MDINRHKDRDDCTSMDYLEIGGDDANAPEFVCGYHAPPIRFIGGTLRLR